MSFPLRSLCLAAGLAASCHAFAQADDSGELRERASAIRAAAEAAYAKTTYACYDKFLVNACLDDARLERIDRVKEARVLEARANRIDRGARIKAMEARLRKVESRPEPATVTPVAPPAAPEEAPAASDRQ